MPALQVKVSLTAPYPESYPGAPTDKLSVQFAVAALCKQAGLDYDAEASQQNVGDAAKSWVRPDFKDVPLDQALGLILGPLGLTYEVTDAKLVLRRKEDLPTRPDPAGKQDVPPFIQGMADRQARAAAWQRLAQQLAQVNAVLLQGRQAVAAREKARQEGLRLQQNLAEAEAQVKEAEEKVKDAWDSGWSASGVRWLTPQDMNRYETWGRRLGERSADRDRASQPVRLKQADFDQASAQVADLERRYQDMRLRLQAEFNRIYQEEYQRQVAALLALAAEKRAELEAERAARLTEEAVRGDYVWIQGGKELGAVKLTPGGSVGGDAAHQGDSWQLGEDGLRVVFGGDRWLFQPGAAGTYVGVYAGEDEAKLPLSAMLKPAQEAARGEAPLRGTAPAGPPAPPG